MQNEMRRMLVEIRAQRSVIFKEFERDKKEYNEYTEGATVWNVKDSEGHYVMIPLLLAESNILLALSNLKGK